jgi:sec-independent protein translocase protein TatC
MLDPQKSPDELAGSEQPFVQHLMELRNRVIYGMAGLLICMLALAFWPGPSGLIDMIAVPIRAHMPPDAKLIAVDVFSPFFVPIKVLAMTALLLSLPWWMYQIWAFVAPGLYSHEKKFAIPLITLGSLLAYVGIGFVQFFVLDKMFGFIQQFTPASVAATPDIASYVEAILSLYLAFGLAFQVPIVVILAVKMNLVTVKQLKEFRGLRWLCPCAYFTRWAYGLRSGLLRRTSPQTKRQKKRASRQQWRGACSASGLRRWGPATRCDA